MIRIGIDTGGTFTDCLGVDPRGALRRVKVLSSAALRGRIGALGPGAELRIDGLPLRHEDVLPEDFCRGAVLRRLGTSAADGELQAMVTASAGARLTLTERAASWQVGDTVEISFDQEAPILAARLLTGTADASQLPPLTLRLATTRGTNALLERRGARTAWLVTAGFGDLLRIGEQHRPDLFARRVRRPPPIYERVVEIDERLNAAGEVLRPLDLDAVTQAAAELRREGIESVAVSFMHSYLNPAHEQAVEHVLRRAGFGHVSCSARLTPTLKLLSRARTACVDAYLAPVVGRYLSRVAGAVGRHRLLVMTSAGGLVPAPLYRAKDSLLSGPAGGVVGAARCGAEHGFGRVVAFDMGGTSTDVSRVRDELDYAFEHTVGDVTLAAPALRIETVAAGGGSICSIDAGVLKVGPESAGAFPGPACYGAGGPLTVTDVNLLLGRLDGERFEIPIEPAAAARRADELLADLRRQGSELDLETLLLGYLEIADQRMADAVRRISVRQGYDPKQDAMVAFGGAGGLHACYVAELLAMSTVLWPREAGLLSAFGLGAAAVEHIEERQVLQPLGDLGTGLAAALQGMARRAAQALVRDAGAGDSDEAGLRAEVKVRRRLAYLRFRGQESTLEVDLGPEPSIPDVVAGFLERYTERYGYVPRAGADPVQEIELESLRLVAALDAPLTVRRTSDPASARDLQPAQAAGSQRAFFGDGYLSVPVFDMEALEPLCRLDGPALIFDRHASFVLPPAWWASVSETGALVARREPVTSTARAAI